MQPTIILLRAADSLDWPEEMIDKREKVEYVAQIGRMRLGSCGSDCQLNQGQCWRAVPYSLSPKA